MNNNAFRQRKKTLIEVNRLAFSLMSAKKIAPPSLLQARDNLTDEIVGEIEARRERKKAKKTK